MRTCRAYKLTDVMAHLKRWESPQPGHRPSFTGDIREAATLLTDLQTW